MGEERRGLDREVKKGEGHSSKYREYHAEKLQAEPHVSVGFVDEIRVQKRCDILHTVQLKQARISGAAFRPSGKDGATIYNLALPDKGVSIEKPIKKYYRYSKDTGFIQIKSNTHECIQGYIFIFDHPYAAVTDDQGSFLIDGLVPGEYVLTAWHEGFAAQKQRFIVKSGEAANVEIELK
jgi:hypothetical protein